MSIESTHPEFDAMLSKWERNIDSYLGEDKIKKESVKYLPHTSSQKLDGAESRKTSDGGQAYEAYKMRAVYPDLFKIAVEGTLGILHKAPPLIDLPPQLEFLRKDATLNGESLEDLLMNINTQQLITGRVGVLPDIPDNRGQATICLYNAQTIRNWDDDSINATSSKFKFVILDESGYEVDDDYEWDYEQKYRLLTIVDGKFGWVLVNGDDSLVDISNFQEFSRMGQTLDYVPFNVANSKNIASSPDIPPFDGLALLCLAIYRAEADYRQSLFMQGQDTLVTKGLLDDDDAPIRTGAGGHIKLPDSGDAQFIGVSSSGLSEQRTALENDYNRAIQKSGQLIDNSKSKESAEALKLRMSANSATLPQIAKAGALALENTLKAIAELYDANPDEVSIVPNLNFTKADLNGDTLVKIIQAKTQDAPISDESIHDWMRKEGFTTKDYESELAAIELEKPRGSDVDL